MSLGDCGFRRQLRATNKDRPLLSSAQNVQRDYVVSANCRRVLWRAEASNDSGWYIKRQFFSAFGRHIFVIVKDKAISYGNISFPNGFLLTRKQMTLNDFEWPIYVKLRRLSQNTKKWSYTISGKNVQQEL